MVRAALGFSCPRAPLAGIQVADAPQQGIGKAACLSCAVLALLLRRSLAGATQPQRRTAADFSAQPNPSGSLLHRPMLRRHARCWPRQRGGVQCWTRLTPQQRRSASQLHERLCMCPVPYRTGCLGVIPGSKSAALVCQLSHTPTQSRSSYPNAGGAGPRK